MKILIKIVGIKNIGKIEYYLYPNLKEVFGGPFNGQKNRQTIFLDIISNLKIDSIIETGTFRGSTTSFFINTQLPVYSVELNKRYYGYSKKRFKKFHNIKLFNDNSINFLKDISNNNLFSKSNIFFYLDAHGSGDNNPLSEEVELIFDNFTNSIVMIDDFEVPNTNYGFDTRLGHKLNINLLNTIISNYNLTIFFPLLDSEEETGRKRGMALLCKENEICISLQRNKYIYKYQNN